MDIDRLIKIVGNIGGLFCENELAYLSLTSKNESIIRDKIAYRLNLELDKSKYIIAREYKRIDIVILENNSIKDIIELKSIYTYDVETKKGLDGYINS
ncbi:hypothetical protein [Clostridium aciditolerans]|uniref:Uncharacterized protein n=1 Tax=Clostridium aciditolerans TaxID=339861 RepID=A0A934HZT9_9CLOT|nr:hypothetical protein [Clostridium aciditolerans]MBI6873430.1 hypothetical protein [Clostridium aciditolerans]